MTKEVKIGIRINSKPGVEFFGVEDVNSLISQGGRVVSIQQGDAIFTKIGENGGTVRMVLGGCEVKVVMEFPAMVNSPIG
jgi:hypothetical protein